MLSDTQIRRHIAAHIPIKKRRQVFTILKNGIELARGFKLPSVHDYSTGQLITQHHSHSGRPNKSQQAAIIASALARGYLVGTGKVPNLKSSFEGKRTAFEEFAEPVLIHEGHRGTRGILTAHTKIRNKPLNTISYINKQH